MPQLLIVVVPLTVSSPLWRTSPLAVTSNCVRLLPANITPLISFTNAVAPVNPSVVKLLLYDASLNVILELPALTVAVSTVIEPLWVTAPLAVKSSVVKLLAASIIALLSLIFAELPISASVPKSLPTFIAVTIPLPAFSVTGFPAALTIPSIVISPLAVVMLSGAAVAVKSLRKLTAPLPAAASVAADIAVTAPLQV